MNNSQVIIPDNIYIPQQMFNYIIQVINKFPQQQIFQFKYSDLLKYAMDYEYQKARQFRQNLAKYSQLGSYYILFCQYDKQLYYKNLIQIMPIQKIQYLYKNMFNVFGITSYGFVHKTNLTNKNCLTILNKTVLKLDDWIGTLQHQMTHFIQRFIGLDQTLLKNYQKKIDKKEQNIHPDIIKFATKLAKYTDNNDDFIQSLNKKFTYMLSKNQLQQTLKTLFLMFKNMYMRNITFVNGKICQIQIKYNIQQRMQWLNQFLKLINSNQYLESEQFKSAINLWKKKSILCSEEQLIKHRYISYILAYLAIKNILPQLNIDEKLKQFFKNIGEK